MDLDKKEGIKYVNRDDLGDFGADNIDGFMNYIAQQIGDDENSILPEVMEKNAQAEFLYKNSQAHRDDLDTVTGMPTKGVSRVQRFEDHYTPKREKKDWVDSQNTF